jgi:leucyl aminopeptidase
MEIVIDTGLILKKKYPLIVLGIFEGEKVEGAAVELDDVLNGGISSLLQNKEFEGKMKQIALLHTHGKTGIERILLIGLGKREQFSQEVVRVASGKAAHLVRDLGLKSYATTIYGHTERITLSQIVESLVEGSELSLYRYDRYKTEGDASPKKVEHLDIFTGVPEVVEEIQRAVNTAQIINRGVAVARDIANTPSSDATPQLIAEQVKQIAEKYNILITILNPEEMAELGMGGILGVARGSQQPPRLVIMEYRGGDINDQPIAIIGKGITFDSGGISIKPSDKMEDMKFDKSGAAAVIGAMQTVAELNLPVNLVGITPLTENLPSGSAYKPGDVLKISNGKTVEVISTDAEGRLILADALSYTSRFNPQAVIDLATLTGACVIALGGVASGLLGNNEGLKRQVKDAGDATGERVWELPLWDEYKEQIKSEIADMKNVGGRPAGTITAASFLSNFVNYPWVHLDIAGTAWTQDSIPDKPYYPKGATGVGVRLLTEVLRRWMK